MADRKNMRVTDNYLKTLLSYYEEEIEGEAYFYGLIDHFEEQDKLTVLARVERRAAESVVPLLEKYKLVPGDESKLKVRERVTCSVMHLSTGLSLWPIW